MKRSAKWSQAWVFYLTASLLFASSFLRSLVLYHDAPIIGQVIFLLSVWLLLFLGELVLSKWPQFSWHFAIYLVSQISLVLVLLFLPNSSDYFAVLLCILSMQVIRHWKLNVSAIVIGLFTLLLMLPLVKIYGTFNGIAFALIYTGANTILAFFAVTTRRAQLARAENQALVQQLQETNCQLEAYSKRLEQLAAARERQRLARELHDAVTQTIFSMTLTTQSAALLLDRDPSRVGEQLARLGYLAQHALSEMRMLIAELGRDKTGEGTLAARLRQHLADRQMPDGLSITLETEGAESLATVEEQSLFRIAQEALNNIVKHADASQACIRLHLTEPFWIEIQDNGRGFDSDQVRNGGRLGLTSMRERAAEIGWELQIITCPWEGTRIRVEKSARERRV